jgi:L-fucose mutarotase
MLTMLKGLDPLLNADLLQVLRAMGHGDDLVIADANFPATTMARRLVRMDGVAAPRVLEAVLSVMPLDDFVDEPCGRIEVVGDPDAEPEVCQEFQKIIDRAEGGRFQLAKIERFAFYARAREAFAVVQTGETRLYGCVLLKMGVVRPA